MTFILSSFFPAPSNCPWVSEDEIRQEPSKVEDVQAFVDLVESTRLATSDQLKRIGEASAKDAQLLKVVGFTLEGWPNHAEKVPLRHEGSLILVDTCQ